MERCRTRGGFTVTSLRAESARIDEKNMDNSSVGHLMEKTNFLERYNLTEQEFRQTGLEWPLLEQIHNQHLDSTKDLQSVADYVSGRLQSVPAVHSLKVRIKNAEHLIEKIIRKKRKTPNINFDCVSYESIITDLIGIRALHLFKDEWKQIHDFVTHTWDLHETPLAYVRRGDPDEISQAFRDAGCEVKEHDLGYRSIHYLLKTQPAKCVRLVELQVRTIFEEAWSEIDHKVRYPRHSSNPYLAAFLAIFNRLAGAADEMGTFTTNLNVYVQEQELQRRQNEAKLSETVSRLKISEDEKDDLRRRIGEMIPALTISGAGAALLSAADYPIIALPAQLQTDLTSLLRGETKTCSVCNQLFQSYPLDVISAGAVDQCPDCREKGVQAMFAGMPKFPISG